MQNKSLLYPAISGIVLVIIVMFLANYFGVHRYKNEIPKPADTTWSISETVKVDSTLIQKLKAQIYTLKNQKPVIIRDTVLLGKEQYYAEADTTYKEDSSSIKVRYYFPPLNYFDIAPKIHTKQTTITKTITVNLPCESSFWDKFSWGVNADIVSYNAFTKEVQFGNIGVGIHFDLKKVFGD